VDYTTYEIFVQLPVLYPSVVEPSFLKIHFIAKWGVDWKSISFPRYGGIRLCNTVSENTAVIQACQRRDVQAVQALLRSGEADTRDKTPGNLSLLYVRFFSNSSMPDIDDL
jgi:hypothetical protein